jgi:hypothetical protein
VIGRNDCVIAREDCVTLRVRSRALAHPPTAVERKSVACCAKMKMASFFASPVTREIFGPAL